MRAPRRRLMTCAMLTGAAALLSTACSGTGTRATPPATAASPTPTPVTASPQPSSSVRWPSGLPDPAAVDGNPTAVSRAAVTIMWTVDYSTDQGGQHDAQLRALPLLTPAYAAQIRAAQPSAPSPDAWVRKHVRTRVQMRPGDEDRPMDTTSTAYRQWLLTVTTVDPAGHRQVAPVHVTAYVILNRSAGQPWRVASVSTF